MAIVGQFSSLCIEKICNLATSVFDACHLITYSYPFTTQTILTELFITETLNYKFWEIFLVRRQVVFQNHLISYFQKYNRY